jgi:S1-C subfamily serine protease
VSGTEEAAAEPAAAQAAGSAASPVPLTRPGPEARTSWWSLLLPLTAFLSVVLLAAYAASVLLVRWHLAEGQALAEAAYMKRKAELKAEAEAADQRLDLLDRRTHLVSLGFRETVRKVTPAVVNVGNLRAPRAADATPLLKPHLHLDPRDGKHYLQVGTGSGLLVKAGYVLTNEHVVKGAQRLLVTFASGRSVGVPVERVATDPLTDLAVIHLPEDLPAGLREDADVTAAFANSDRDIERGDLVLALGSPLGLKQTVTHGIISAKGRLLSMLDTVELLQTDAPINPGNSGGPLFDQYGRVVGINVAIASETGGNQGIGFVIPSNTARAIFDMLAGQGEVVRGFIGAALEEVPAEQARRLGLGDGGGVLVSRVVPGFPAEQAGLQPGDVVFRYNGEPISADHPGRHLRQRILESPVGRRVSVEVRRQGERHTLTIEIGRRPAKMP